MILIREDRLVLTQCNRYRSPWFPLILGFVSVHHRDLRADSRCRRDLFHPARGPMMRAALTVGPQETLQYGGFTEVLCASCVPGFIETKKPNCLIGEWNRYFRSAWTIRRFTLLPHPGADTILATIPRMTWGSCWPAVPSSV